MYKICRTCSEYDCSNGPELPEEGVSDAEQDQTE